MNERIRLFGTDEDILNFQKELHANRKRLGITAEELGFQLGVSRQTICNLETCKTRMSKSQYVTLALAVACYADRYEDEELVDSIYKEVSNWNFNDLAEAEERDEP